MRHRDGVRLDKRAAMIAAAAVAVGVVLGYWSSAGSGVLAALAGLIPAVVWQVAAGLQGDLMHGAVGWPQPRLRSRRGWSRLRGGRQLRGRGRRRGAVPPA